jgi:hypothetical protein
MSKYAVHLIYLPNASVDAVPGEQYLKIRYHTESRNEVRTLPSNCVRTPLLLAEGDIAFVSFGYRVRQQAEPIFTVEDQIIGGDRLTSANWLTRMVVREFSDKDDAVEQFYGQGSDGVVDQISHEPYVPTQQPE